jgi:hypothetical protein
LTLNRKRDMDSVTPTETTRSTNPEMSSDVIDL